MRDENEGRKKQARSNKQTRQSNTAHPRQSCTFPKKTSCLGWVKLGQYLAIDLVGFFKELYMEIQLWIRYSRREGGKAMDTLFTERGGERV